MKKYWIILCAGLLSMGLLAGCAGQEQNKTGQKTNPPILAGFIRLNCMMYR